MKETIKKLWNGYLVEECAVIDTEKERQLSKIAVELHEKASASLNREQKNAVEKYIDALCDVEALFVEKAFCSGCKFAVSFLLEARDK